MFVGIMAAVIKAHDDWRDVGGLKLQCAAITTFFQLIKFT